MFIDNRSAHTKTLFPPSIDRRSKMNELFSSTPVKASNILGMNVANPEGESLGTIKEIVIDTHHGRIAYAVVSFGGFLSMGAKLFAIPFSAFAYNMTKNEYVLDVSKEQLKGAPGFDPGHWPSMAEEKWNREVSKYYQRPPYWE